MTTNHVSVSGFHQDTLTSDLEQVTSPLDTSSIPSSGSVQDDSLSGSAPVPLSDSDCNRDIPSSGSIQDFQSSKLPSPTISVELIDESLASCTLVSPSDAILDYSIVSDAKYPYDPREYISKDLVLIQSIETNQSTSSLNELPPVYQQFADVFSEVNADILPQHRKYDCPIDLLPNSTPPRK